MQIVNQNNKFQLPYKITSEKAEAQFACETCGIWTVPVIRFVDHAQSVGGQRERGVVVRVWTWNFDDVHILERVREVTVRQLVTRCPVQQATHCLSVNSRVSTTLHPCLNREEVLCIMLYKHDIGGLTSASLRTISCTVTMIATVAEARLPDDSRTHPKASVTQLHSVFSFHREQLVNFQSRCCRKQQPRQVYFNVWWTTTALRSHRWLLASTASTSRRRRWRSAILRQWRLAAAARRSAGCCFATRSATRRRKETSAASWRVSVRTYRIIHRWSCSLYFMQWNLRQGRCRRNASHTELSRSVRTWDIASGCCPKCNIHGRTSSIPKQCRSGPETDFQI